MNKTANRENYEQLVSPKEVHVQFRDSRGQPWGARVEFETRKGHVSFLERADSDHQGQKASVHLTGDFRARTDRFRKETGHFAKAVRKELSLIILTAGSFETLANGKTVKADFNGHAYLDGFDVTRFMGRVFKANAQAGNVPERYRSGRVLAGTYKQPKEVKHRAETLRKMRDKEVRAINGGLLVSH